MPTESSAKSPDFYLVAGHGTGSASLQIYCRILGIPLKFPNQQAVPRLKNPLPVAGCIIDRPVTIPPSWDREKPIFWLLRDPFAALFNVINNNIWLSSATIAHRGWPMVASPTPLASFCHGYRADLGLRHSTRLLSIYKGQKIYCIDHQDLYQDKIYETMLFIGKTLGFDLHSRLSKHSAQRHIAYGDRVKRLWLQAPRHFILRRIKNLVLRCRITVCPLLWLDFKYANYDSYQILETFTKDNEELAIVCDDIAAARNDAWKEMTPAQLLGHFSWGVLPSTTSIQARDVTALSLEEWERTAVLDSTELFCATLNIHKNFLEKRLLTRESLFEQIWADVDTRTKFKILLDKEMPLVRELAPKIYANFSYVHEFYRRFSETSSI